MSGAFGDAPSDQIRTTPHKLNAPMVSEGD